MSPMLVEALAQARSIDRAPHPELAAANSLDSFLSQSQRWILAAGLGYGDECLLRLDSLAQSQFGTSWSSPPSSPRQFEILSLGIEILYAARSFEMTVQTAEALLTLEPAEEVSRHFTVKSLLNGARAAGVARGYDYAEGLVEHAVQLYGTAPMPRALEALRALVSAQLNYFRDDNLGNARSEIEIAVALLRDGDRPSNLSFALRIRGMIQKALGHVHAAQDSYTEATQVAIRSRNSYQIAMSLQHLAIAKYRLGEIKRATLLSRLAIRCLPRNSKPQDRFQCELTFVRCLLLQERYDTAMQRLEALSHVESGASQRLHAIAIEYRAIAEIGLGQVDSALALLDKAEEILQTAKIGSYENFEMRLRRAEALNLIGQHREAREVCDLALTTLHSREEQLERGHLLRQRAIATYFGGRPDDALRDFNAAERELRQVADRYELTKLLLDRAELFAPNRRQVIRDLEEAVSLAASIGVESLESRAREMSELSGVRLQRSDPNAHLDVTLRTGIIAKAPATLELLARAKIFGSHDLPVLITGETGAGKELVANLLHESSPRSERQMVCVNCAAMPEHIIERELFGHVRGAFTGADRDSEGLVDAADGGSLFLDEIGELSGSLQAKLLRLLQDGSYRPVGSTVERKASLRVIAATHRDLRRMVARKEFRDDLYYRIAGLRLHIPSLRERPEDILAIGQHLMERASSEHGVDFWMEKDAWTLLREFTWPGNVRQLQMVIRALCIHALPGGVIRRSHVLEQLGDELPSVAAARRHAPLHLQREVEAFERRLILRALQETNYCRTSAAKLLGLGRNTFYEKMKRLGMEPQESKSTHSREGTKAAKRGKA